MSEITIRRYTAAELLPIVQRAREVLAANPLRPVGLACVNDEFGHTCWCLGWELAHQSGVEVSQSGFGYHGSPSDWPMARWTDGMSCPEYNDTHTKDEIVAMLDRAIADLTAEVRPKRKVCAPSDTTTHKPGTKGYSAHILRRVARDWQSGKAGWRQDSVETENGGCLLVMAGNYGAFNEPPGRGFGEVSSRELVPLATKAYEDMVYTLIGANATTGHSLGIYNDKKGNTRENMILLARCIAYMLDHGGKVPKQAAKLIRYAANGRQLVGQ